MLNKVITITLLVISALFVPTADIFVTKEVEQSVSPLNTPEVHVPLKDFEFSYVSGDFILKVSPVEYASFESARDAFLSSNLGASVMSVHDGQRFITIGYRVNFFYFPKNNMLYTAVWEPSGNRIIYVEALSVNDGKSVAERFSEVEEIIYALAQQTRKG